SAPRRTNAPSGPPLTHCPAAPRPSPPRGRPQPIRPTRVTSLPAACTLATLLQPAASPAPTAAEAFRKSRREDRDAVLCGIDWSKIVTPLARQTGELIWREDGGPEAGHPNLRLAGP